MTSVEVNALLSIEFVGLANVFYNNMNEEEH
jgi:hypothetical protein